MQSPSSSFGHLTDKNVEQLRTLNLQTFPVKYSNKFYKDVLREENKYITKYLYHCDTVVGAVCCRREYDDVNSGKAKVYIMTLGVLKAYRKLGFGSKMLDYVLEQVKKDATVSYVYLHVQVNNQVAIEFYKKYGFQVIERIEDYYKKIEPHACFLLKYNVHV